MFRTMADWRLFIGQVLPSPSDSLEFHRRLSNISLATSRLPKRISCYWECTDLEASEPPQRSLTNYEVCVVQCPVILCGDFNIHADDSDDSTTVQFSELLKSYDCIQHVTGSTHSHGHTLDLVISNTENIYNVNNLTVHGLLSLVRPRTC